jgi:outer membrane protein TolC
VDVSNTQADLSEQKRLRDISRTGLLRALGVDQDSQVDLVTPLTYDDQEPPSFAQAVQAAFYNRPDIYQAAIALDLQELALRDAKTRWWPRLDAYFWDMLASPDPHGSSGSWGTQWQAGLGLMWTAFDGLAREGRIIQQQALLRQSEIQLDDAEQQVLLELRDALLELQSARELVESQKLNLERANRALELVIEAYNVKVRTEVEVLDAQAALTRAKALHYGALHRHASAKLALRRAMGFLSPPPGAESVPQKVENLTDISLPAAPAAEPGGAAQPTGGETPQTE